MRDDHFCVTLSTRFDPRSWDPRPRFFFVRTPDVTLTYLLILVFAAAPFFVSRTVPGFDRVWGASLLPRPEALLVFPCPRKQLRHPLLAYFSMRCWNASGQYS